MRSWIFPPIDVRPSSVNGVPHIEAKIGVIRIELPIALADKLQHALRTTINDYLAEKAMPNAFQSKHKRFDNPSSSE